MEGIIEYIDVKYPKAELTKLFNEVNPTKGLDYIECGTESYVLSMNPNYYVMWEHIIEWCTNIHPQLCEMGTGFNSNPTLTSGVPPHIDFDERKGNKFNLLLPLFGVAKIGIYETIPEQLEFRHGKTHWNMLQDQYPPNKIGELVLDKPALLNTDYLHSVKVIDAPRAIFCVAWRGINMSYNEFKDYAEKTLT